jgi:hypothetical protein
MKLKHVVIGKFGRSICFNPDRWNAVGGDNEPPAYYTALASHNPDVTFYMIGKSDLSRISPELLKKANPHGNIINVWADYVKPEVEDDMDDACVVHPAEWMKARGIVPDAGVFFAGPTSRVNMNNRVYSIREPDRYVKTSMMFKNYAGPIIHYLNEFRTPYVNLVPDPRFHPCGGVDLLHPPMFSLSQFNDETPMFKHIKSFDDQRGDMILSEAPLIYAGVETIFCIGREKPNFETGQRTVVKSLLSFDDDQDDSSFLNKTIKFMIVLNEGSAKLNRGKLLREYVLDHIADVDVFGQWSDSWYEDKRFKGPLKFSELQKKIPHVKYTFIIPIERGWSTAKYIEMIQYGIIPFMHPFYDEQRNLPVPDFIRVSSSKELFERIEFLEQNPDEYQKLLMQLSEVLQDDYYSGVFINSITMNALEGITK